MMGFKALGCLTGDALADCRGENFWGLTLAMDTLSRSFRDTPELTVVGNCR